MKNNAVLTLYEDKQHITRSFPFNIYPCCIPVDFAAVSLHWQSSMELIYIKKGTGIVQCGVDILEAQPGDLFIIPPAMLHALRALSNQRMEYENFFFDLRFLGLHNTDICAQKYLLPLANGQLKLPVLIRQNHPQYPEIASCLKACETLCQSCEKGYELGVKANIMKLIFLLLQSSSAPSLSHQDERLSQLLQTIEEHYAEPFSIEDAARQCGYSNSHFMRWFKETTGSSFISYLNERRLAAAASGLLNSKDTILSISQRCGFDNLSHFNRQFKKAYGCSPSEYRKKE